MGFPGQRDSRRSFPGATDVTVRQGQLIPRVLSSKSQAGRPRSWGAGGGAVARGETRRRTSRARTSPHPAGQTSASAASAMVARVLWGPGTAGLE